MNKKKILNDPVYGFITLRTDLIFDLIEHPYFQRLRRIKQMGLTHYVYPGALHTRFHHALGAMHLMHKAIDTIRAKGATVTAEEEEGAIIAILLHDIGHGPYSHTLEGLILNCEHEQITLLFMHRLNEIFAGKLATAIAIFEGTYPKSFLHELITGQLDLDRMDYLKRDSFFSGVPEGNIGHDRIIAMLDVVDNHIVVELKGRYTIEQFLLARRLMYWQVYLHKAGLAAESMLRRCMEVLRRELHQDALSPADLPENLTYFLRQHIDPTRQDNADDVLHLFAELDDVDVTGSLKVLARSDHRLLSYLANSILRRRLFHTQFLDAGPSASYARQFVNRIHNELEFSGKDSEMLVITGYESIPTYKVGEDEINIVMSNRRVLPLSHILELSMDAVSEAHYMCYPKVIRQ